MDARTDAHTRERIDIEQVRFPGEAAALQLLRDKPAIQAHLDEVAHGAALTTAQVRRRLQAATQELTEGMLPLAWAAARHAAQALGVQNDIEIYRARGGADPTLLLHASPIFIEVDADVLAYLDGTSLRSRMGSEIGRWLAHRSHDPDPMLGVAVRRALAASPSCEATRTLAGAYVMACEITYDRCGLLACGDLHACLRRELFATTGLTDGAVQWDTEAYLLQCRSLVDSTNDDPATHAEHALRAWALWRFRESDLCKRALGDPSPGVPLFEVNREIEERLRQANVAKLIEATRVLEPLPDVHECALAAAALVALADGELSDAEVSAIERVFSSLIDDWQRYLVWDHALASFHDASNLVRRLGVAAQRSVFHTIARVVVASGSELHTSTIDMVCAVGDALGCGTMFRAMLAPILATFGLGDEDLSARATVVPMAARAQEAEQALQRWFDGMRRRGGGRVLARRLFLLLGDPTGSTAAREQVRRATTQHGLVAEPCPSVVDLEGEIVFARAPGAVAATGAAFPVAVGPTDPTPVRLGQALGRLRDRLVSGDGRSPSIRLRVCRSGASFDLRQLEELSTGHAFRAVELVRGGARARLVDGAEVAKHSGAAQVSRELVLLERAARARTEQTGARDLFLGTAFLVGVHQGYLYRAPLLLTPVELERLPGRGFELVPRAGEPALPNVALVRLLFMRKGLAYTEELGQQLGVAVEDGEEALLMVLREHGFAPTVSGEMLEPFLRRDEEFEGWADDRFDVEANAVLGFFPQSSSDLIQDYDALLQRVADPGPELAPSLGAAGALLPYDLREALRIPPIPPCAASPVTPIVPADPSQLEVVRAARESRALVVDGPPGTGKSQVIVNLIADALAHGQRVAVVCEKRAAIDVVAQRLDVLGMRHLLGVVHDVHEDRRTLFEQVRARIAAQEGREVDSDAVARVDERLDEVRAALYDRRAALCVALHDASPTLGQLHLLAASFETPALPDLDPSILRLTHADVQRLAERIGREERNRDLAMRGSVWRAPDGAVRPSIATMTPVDRARIEEQLGACTPMANALDELCQWQSVAVGPTYAARDAIAGAIQCLSGVHDGVSSAWLATLMKAHGNRVVQELMDRLATLWSDVEMWRGVVPARASFRGAPETEGAMVLVRRRSGSIWRFFSRAWWRARRHLRALLADQWPQMGRARVDVTLVEQVTRRTRGSVAWSTLDETMRRLGLPAAADDTDLARIEVDELLRFWRIAMHLAHHRPALEAAGAWIDPGAPVSDWRSRLMARQEIVTCASTLAEAFAPVRRWFPWQSPTPLSAVVEELKAAWAMESARVGLSDKNMDAAREIYPHAHHVVCRLADLAVSGAEVSEPGRGGAPLAPSPASASRSHTQCAIWADAVEHGWVVLSIHATERRHPEARELDRDSPLGEVHELEGQLVSLIEERSRLHVESLLARLDNTRLLTEALPAYRQRRNEVQRAREQMLHEAGKRRYIMTLRAFVRQFWDQGLSEILPVWLVSPETMAVLFPSAPTFDVVIMDEASQCSVEKGFSALVRGHRAVVAGDEKQMPPTSYFSVRTGEDDDGEHGTVETMERDALAAESLLVLARDRCRHLGLRWHYRCLYEELIAFSNHAMYGGDLMTIPSIATSRAPSALRWVQVDDGVYDRGTNRVEAQRVVDELDRSLRDAPSASLGVVTFNTQQQSAIVDAIDERVESDGAFAERWLEAMGLDEVDRRPFVKNLESVQGDERDVIVFSLGHAPVPRRGRPEETYVPARFGPLSQAGGERRLNVAISRAKQSCVVVASFEPRLLSVADTLHDGPKLLKAFLEYVWDFAHDRRVLAARTLDRIRGGGMDAIHDAPSRRVHGPRLASQIGTRLAALGITYDLDVGTSGFRVPLAIRHPADPGRYCVAVLTDEGDQIGDIDEVHRHEPLVLAARGWDVTRVDARAWHRDADGVIARLAARTSAA